MPTSGRYVKKTGFKTRIRQCSAKPTAVVVVAFVVVVFTVVVVLVVVVVVVDVPIFVVVDVPAVGRGVVDVPIVVVVGGVPVVGRDVVVCAAANRIIYIGQCLKFYRQTKCRLESSGPAFYCLVLKIIS